MVMFVAIFVTKKYIESEHFSSLISEKVTLLLQKKSQSDINFKNIEINLFSQKTTLHQVNLSLHMPTKEKISIDLEKVEFQFGLADYISSKISISKVVFSGGGIELPDSLLESSESEFKIDNLSSLIFTKYQEYLENGPVLIRNILLKDIHIINRNIGLNLKSVEAMLFENYFDTKVELENISYIDKNKKFNLDSIQGEVNFERNAMKILSLSLRQKLNILNIKGIFKNNKVKGLASYEGNGKYLNTILPSNLKGLANSFYRIHLSYPEFSDFRNLKFSGSIDNLETGFFHLDHALFKGGIKDEILKISHFESNVKEEKIVLTSPFKLFDFKQNEIINNTANIKLFSLKTSSIFKFLNGSMDPFVAKVSGPIKIEWDRKKLSIKLLPKSYLSDFSLDINDSTILSNKHLKVKKGHVDVFFSGNVFLDIGLSLGNTLLNCSGMIYPHKIDLKVTKSHLKISDLGKIAGVVINGEGSVELEIKGEYKDNVVFDFLVDLEGFELLGMNYGKVKGDFSLFLKDVKLRLNNIISEKSNTNTMVFNGDINFTNKDNSIDLDIKIEKSSFHDTLNIFSSMIKKSEYYNHLDFDFRGGVHLIGGFDIALLNISGDLHGDYLNILKDEFLNLDLSFSFKKRMLDIVNISFEKGDGRVKGSFKYGFLKNDMVGMLQLKKIRGSDFRLYNSLNLGLDGELKGYVNFSGTAVNNLKLDGLFNIEKTVVGNEVLKNSVLKIEGKNGLFNLIGRGFGESLKINSLLDFNQNKNGGPEKKSYFDGSLKINEISKMLGIVSRHNISRSDIQGNLELNYHSDFSIYDWMGLDFELVVSKFNFNYIDSRYTITHFGKKGSENIRIKNGIIELWNLEIDSGKEFFRSKGSGDLRRSFTLQHIFKLNSGFLQIISPKIIKASGLIHGEGELIGNNKGFDNYIRIKADKNIIKIDKIPGVFNNIEFNVSLINDNLNIDNMQLTFGRGNIEVKGGCLLKVPFPDVDINISIVKSFIPFFKKSNGVFSGELKIIGDTLPYKLSGDIAVLQANFLDEFTVFSKGGNKAENDVYSKYLPTRMDTDRVDYLDNNVNVGFLTPVFVKNKLAELKFTGTAQLQGGILFPRVNAHFKSVPGKSKFLFKGNDFVVVEGVVKIEGSKFKNKPEYKFKSTAKIDDYSLRLSVWGDGKDISMDFSSDPFLSQQDIFSLLTIGVTSEKSQVNVGQGASLATSGIGNILMEQFNINRELDNTLGLKVNFLSDVKNDENPLEGRTSSSASGNKSRTFTKIKLQKKVLKNVDISVSSTIGGDVGGNQEMNIMYKINNELSVEGIYEKTSEQEIEDDSSMGIDFKYRKTFK